MTATSDRIPCCVPFCRRTTKLQPLAAQFAHPEWICADHWRTVPRDDRARVKRIAMEIVEIGNGLIQCKWRQGEDKFSVGSIVPVEGNSDLIISDLAVVDEPYRSVKPDGLPRAMVLAIDCPCCGLAIEYEPAEDDAGGFGALHDWPVCEVCKVVIDVSTIRLVKAEERFDAIDMGG